MDNSPNPVDVHYCVAVDQDIAERDDLLQVRYLTGKGLVVYCQLAEGFANDPKLPLHSGAQHET